jgi:hypothetical protein
MVQAFNLESGHTRERFAALPLHSTDASTSKPFALLF